MSLSGSSNVLELDAYEVSQLIESGDAFVIDVREASEYNFAHVDGSINIPLSEFDLALRDSNFSDIVSSCQQKRKKLIFVCAAGVRSMGACQMMDSQFSREYNIRVYNMKGGIYAWIELGFNLIGMVNPNK